MAGIAGDIESFGLPQACQKEKIGGGDAPFLMWSACDCFSHWILEILVSLTLFQHFRCEPFSTKEIHAADPQHYEILFSTNKHKEIKAN